MIRRERDVHRLGVREKKEFVPSGLDSKMEFPMIGDDVSVIMEAETSVELGGWTSRDVTTVGREAIGVLKISDSLGTIVNPVVDANRLGVMLSSVCKEGSEFLDVGIEGDRYTE